MKMVVNKFVDLPLYENADHKMAYIKDCVSVEDAKESGIALSKVMYEKLSPGGQIYPHIHDVGEVIYIISGDVEFLVNGEWKRCGGGDTVIAPAGLIHSVRNIHSSKDSEQVSYFIPMTKNLIEVDMKTEILSKED